MLMSSIMNSGRFAEPVRAIMYPSTLAQMLSQPAQCTMKYNSSELGGTVQRPSRATLVSAVFNLRPLNKRGLAKQRAERPWSTCDSSILRDIPAFPEPSASQRTLKPSVMGAF